MIRSLLVANRAEIARRIFRTCREMGIETIAVFSDADRSTPFVREADRGFALGGASPADSYLRIDALVEAAKATQADAIHPGYGFLAENADFAQAVLDAGLIWVGPSPDSMRAMGSKLESKRLITEAGVPTLPSVDLSNLSAGAIEAAARGLGYPLVVKASAGGGGKGMRVISNPADLLEAVEGARRESLSAFGDGTIFIERYLDSPRHIEVQVFGDIHGNIVSLFERECSIQRRHQKIVEESPSPALTSELRDSMAQAAVAAARVVEYVGAGTVEFLFQDDHFYFLEMNTRLQVEHPVTEEITGLDLVRLQLKVASGEPLPTEALEPAMFGHAIEVRLYAEDPRNGFLPVTGALDRFELPEIPGLRIDTGVDSGSEVSVHYDPMLAKVVCWAESRTEAATTLASALQRAQIHGSITNRDLLVRILRHPEFLAGAIDTHFLDRHDPAELGRPLPDSADDGLAAAAAALSSQTFNRENAPVLASIPSGWRNNPSQPQSMELTGEYGTREVGYRFSRDGVTVEVDGQSVGTVYLHTASPEQVGLEIDGHLRWYRTHRVGRIHHVDGPAGYSRFVEEPRFPNATIEEEPGSLHAPMPGKVIKMAVFDGDAVSEGQVLAVIEAMKMEHSLRAPFAGTVKAVMATEGEQVDAEQILIVVEGRA